jgi:hypothetical protein
VDVVSSSRNSRTSDLVCRETKTEETRNERTTGKPRKVLQKVRNNNPSADQLLHEVRCNSDSQAVRRDLRIDSERMMNPLVYREM